MRSTPSRTLQRPAWRQHCQNPRPGGTVLTLETSGAIGEEAGMRPLQFLEYWELSFAGSPADQRQQIGDEYPLLALHEDVWINKSAHETEPILAPLLIQTA